MQWLCCPCRPVTDCKMNDLEWPWVAMPCQNQVYASTCTSWIRAFECQKIIQPLRFCGVLCIARSVSQPYTPHVYLGCQPIGRHAACAADALFLCGSWASCDCWCTCTELRGVKCCRRWSVCCRWAAMNAKFNEQSPPYCVSLRTGHKTSTTKHVTGCLYLISFVTEYVSKNPIF